PRQGHDRRDEPDPDGSSQPPGCGEVASGLLRGVVEYERRPQRDQDRRDAQRQHACLWTEARVRWGAGLPRLHVHLDERHDDGAHEWGPPDRAGDGPKELCRYLDATPAGHDDPNRGTHRHGTSDGSAFDGSVMFWMTFLIRSGATPALWGCSS